MTLSYENGLFSDTRTSGSRSPHNHLRSTSSSRERNPSKSLTVPVAAEILLPPYEVAIIALKHELISYAQHLREKIANMTGMPGKSVILRAPTTHIIVLKEVEHVVPCLEDLTSSNVYFAIILNELNLTHSSCTVFILHTPPQQEHRNMPLQDALILLRKSFDEFLDLNPQIVSKLSDLLTPEPVASAEQEVIIDDNVVKTPPLLVNLFKLVAESRFLSIGELDQLMDFIELRRTKLGAPKRLQFPQAESSDLKNKILDMLYPDKQTTETKTTVAPVNVTELVKNSLSNPTVQSAVNSLLNCATSTAAAPAVAVCSPIATTSSKPVSISVLPQLPSVAIPSTAPVQSFVIKPTARLMSLAPTANLPSVQPYMNKSAVRPVPLTPRTNVPHSPNNTAVKAAVPRFSPPRYTPPPRPHIPPQQPNYFASAASDHHQQQQIPLNTQQPMNSFYNVPNQVNQLPHQNFNYGAQGYNNLHQQRPPFQHMY